MIGLLSLPNELLVQILSASPTTRTLCDLACVNKRVHAIWIRHSEQIVTDVYSIKMPHFKDAVDFTLAETRQASTIATDKPPLEGQPLYRHLHSILRNLDLAVKICNHFTDFRKSLPLDDPWYAEPSTSLHSAYFIIRRAVLGYVLPEMRPGLRSELRSLQSNDLETSERILDYIRNFAPHALRCELECVLTKEEMEHVPIDERTTRLSLGWRHAGILLGLALQEKEEDITGLLEEVWTAPPVNEEDLDASYDSDSDAFPFESYIDEE